MGCGRMRCEPMRCRALRQGKSATMWSPRTTDQLSFGALALQGIRREPGVDLRAEAVWGFREGLETASRAEGVFAAVHLEGASVVASLVDRDDHVAHRIEDLRSSARGRVLHRRAAYAAVELPL